MTMEKGLKAPVLLILRKMIFRKKNWRLILSKFNLFTIEICLYAPNSWSFRLPITCLVAPRKFMQNKPCERSCYSGKNLFLSLSRFRFLVPKYPHTHTHTHTELVKKTRYVTACTLSSSELTQPGFGEFVFVNVRLQISIIQFDMFLYIGVPPLPDSRTLKILIVIPVFSYVHLGRIDPHIPI